MARGTEHLAAVLTTVGKALSVQSRTTPTPGPAEILIAAKSIALNPLDHVQRDMGFRISHSPAVLGHDVAGTISAVGASVKDFHAGMRVAALAPAFFEFGKPDYGAMQTRVLVPSANVFPLPDNTNFNQGSTLPMAVATGWTAMMILGIPFEQNFRVGDKQGLLIWGAASSIGGAGVQIGRSLGFEIYATASPKNHDMIKELGVSRVFDYNSKNVVAEIVNAARVDGIVINNAYSCARGTVEQCQQVLQQTKEQEVATVASAIRPMPEYPKAHGTEVKFVAGSDYAQKRTDTYTFIFNAWLMGKLASGEYVPSQPVTVVDGGLESAQHALDTLKAGVSGTKLVLEV